MKLPGKRIIYAGAALLSGLAASGCEYMLPEGIELGQHRVSVQQGNVLTEESIRHLRLGMPPKQVLFLLGTPMVEDPFHNERWDYPFYDEAANIHEESKLDLISLFFEDGKLAEVHRLVRIDEEAEAIERRGELDVKTEWFQPEDAVDIPDEPAADALEPEGAEAEIVAEPEQTPRN